VVVAAGTGVVTFGVGRDRVARVDGWGNLIGDAGSGYSIGRAALDAVMRAYDGRGAETALTAVAVKHWPDLSQAYIELQTNPGYVGLIASFTRDVARLAAEDTVARDICEWAGRELALSATTAVTRIDEASSPTPLICLVGGVFRSEHIKTACVEALRRRWPEYVPFVAEGDALDGALALADLPTDNPLTSLVAVADV
jgi:N-acetylglucosamine kinase-like BadF-type ATPase